MIPYRAQSSVKMLNDSKYFSSPCEESPYLEKARSPCVPAQPPAWQQINLAKKDGTVFFCVRKVIWLMGKPSEYKLKEADRLEEETSLFQHILMKSVQWTHSPSCSPGEAFLCLSWLWTEPRKKAFLVLALLSIPHSAYTRIYISLTKWIAGLVKVSPWNSRCMNFHSWPTSVTFNFLSFLGSCCNISKKQHHTADEGFFELFLLFEDNL